MAGAHGPLALALALACLPSFGLPLAWPAWLPGLACLGLALEPNVSKILSALAWAWNLKG